MNHLLQKESLFVYSDWTEEDIINHFKERFIIKDSITFHGIMSSTYLITTYLSCSQNVPLEDLII